MMKCLPGRERKGSNQAKRTLGAEVSRWERAWSVPRVPSGLVQGGTKEVEGGGVGAVARIPDGFV